MGMRRTVPVKLDVDSDDAVLLDETVDQFKRAANLVVDNCRDDDGTVISAKNKLHERTYERVREETDLHANMVQAARNQAADALKGVLARWEDGQEASLPTFTANFAEYNKRSGAFCEDHATLATVNGRITAEYVLPPEGDNPHTEYLRNDEFDTTSATLHHRDGDWYLHLHTEAQRETPETDVEHPTVLGVDCNVDGYVAVTSTGAFIESADHLNHVREQYERVRGGLQETGTQSAHRTMAQIGSSFAGWSDDLLHRISNAILEEAIEHDCDTIVFEDLSEIRSRISTDKKFQQWAFHRLFEYVEYKAEGEGLTVEQVDPAYTSQRCSKCGTTLEENRDGDAFQCLKCGYELHADYNAAKNIGMKYVRRGPTSRAGRASSHLALKSGMVNGNGRYSPTSSEA
jgi:IS605 OrfB family transposase